MEFYSLAMQRRWEAWSARERGRWLTGQLWNCTDVLPSSMVTDLEAVLPWHDDPLPGSYGRAARALRAEMTAQERVSA